MAKLAKVLKDYTIVCKANEVNGVPHHVEPGDRRITHPTRMAEVMAALKPGQAVHLGGFRTKNVAKHVTGLPKDGGQFKLDNAQFVFTNVSNAKAAKNGVARERSIRRIK